MKEIVRRLLAVLCYYSGIDLLFYRLNRRAKRIITFHNVLPDDIARMVPKIGCSTTLSHFEWAIDELSKYFKFSADVLDPSTASITFDDGICNEYEIAGEALRKRNIPAVMYVAGDAIGATEETMLVTDQLLVWAQFGPRKNEHDLWTRVIEPGYRQDIETRGRKFLAELNAICPISEALANLPSEWRRLRMTGVTEAQLDDLRSRGWSIGWHTKSHFPLGFLPLEERCKELDSPKEYRNESLGYPYGTIEEIGVETLDIAREMGYPAAMSNFPNASPYHGRYFMQRMSPPGNKYELHFLFSGAKYFFQSRKLLPRATSIAS